METAQQFFISRRYGHGVLTGGLLVVIAHLTAGVAFGLSIAAASLLLGHAALTAFGLYVLSGVLVTILSSMASSRNLMHESPGRH
jgi:hypothetical protein